MAALRFASRCRSVALPLQPARRHTQLRAFATARPPSSLFSPLDAFPERHIGPDDHEVTHMLAKLGYDSMDSFVAETVPSKIRVSANSVSNVSIPALSEAELHTRAKELGSQNKPFKSYIGMGYHNSVVPQVILRNVRPPFTLV
jgi:glycine dehydrogenase